MFKRRMLAILIALGFSTALMGADIDCDFNADDDCQFFCDDD